MTAKNHSIGKLGEEIACAYLEQKGYKILETNWRLGRYEIDIIAEFEDVLIFVEVKTRSMGHYYPPEASIGRAKWSHLSHAAGAYMIAVGHEWEIRFDAISVRLRDKSTPHIRHFVDVFFPGWY